MSLSWIDWDIGEVTVISLTGRITLGEGTSRLRDAIHSVMARGRRKIVLNLGEVFYVDSSGLGALVQSHQQVKAEGGELKLMKLQEITRDLIQVTRLYTVFDVYPDEASAVSSFRPAA